jgi:hypothetical protein
MGSKVEPTVEDLSVEDSILIWSNEPHSGVHADDQRRQHRSDKGMSGGGSNGVLLRNIELTLFRALKRIRYPLNEQLGRNRTASGLPTTPELYKPKDGRVHYSESGMQSAWRIGPYNRETDPAAPTRSSNHPEAALIQPLSDSPGQGTRVGIVIANWFRTSIFKERVEIL